MRDLARWRVGAVAGAALIVCAAVAGAELTNSVEAGACVTADEVDEFTDEHRYSMLLCETEAGPGVWIATMCRDRERVVLLGSGGNVVPRAKVRLRVGAGEVHDAIWSNLTGTPFYIAAVDEAPAMAFVNELLDGIAAGDRVVFQVGDDVYRLLVEAAGGQTEVVAEFIARCAALDEATPAEEPAISNG